MDAGAVARRLVVVPRERPSDAIVPAQVSAAWRIVATFMVIAFLLWTAQHSIYPLHRDARDLTGAIVVTMLQRLLRPGYVAGVGCTIAILLSRRRASATGGTSIRHRWFDANVPAIDRNAMVLITTGVPVGYVLPLLPPDARHVGVSNNVNSPGREYRLSEAVGDTIAGFRGPFYGLTYEPEAKTAELREHFGLVRSPVRARPSKAA